MGCRSSRDCLRWKRSATVRIIPLDDVPGRLPLYFACMSRVGRAANGGASPLFDHLPHVYGAALAASWDEETACTVTERVFDEAVRSGATRPHDRRGLAAQAIRFAMRAAPAPAFASMPPQAREAVALARLAGYSVEEIARTLAIAPAEVKRRLCAGLEALTLESQALAS